MSKDKYGVETDIEKRWDKGVSHHPESVRIMHEIADVDWNHNDYHFDWKSGGDGDNGEELMYEMDIVFERRDAVNHRGPIVCPWCGKEKPEKPKMGRVNDKAVTVKCICGCVYTARIVMRVDVEILEVKNEQTRT